MDHPKRSADVGEAEFRPGSPVESCFFNGEPHPIPRGYVVAETRPRSIYLVGLFSSISGPAVVSVVSTEYLPPRPSSLFRTPTRL